MEAIRERVLADRRAHRMIRAGVFALTLASLGSLARSSAAAAPRTRHQPDAGDALWDLAQDFRKQNNRPPRATLSTSSTISVEPPRARRP